MVSSLRKIKNVALLVILSVTIFSAVKISENSKFEEVFAESNIPKEFFVPTTLNNNFTKERQYKDLDFTATVKDFDRRTYALDQFFLKKESPLYGTAKYFTAACNKYNAPKDCTVLVAIAMNETNLCKYSTSAEMHNCWGFGGPGIHRRNFPSFEVSIDKVTDVLANQYGYKYMIDPSLMERTFCGWEPGCTNWGNNIKGFMNQINNFSIELGTGDLFSLR